LRLSKKTRRLARASALSYKVQDEGLRIVETLEFEQPGTARLARFLENNEVQGGRVLVVTGAHATHVYRSSVNLAKVEVKDVHNLTTEDILKAKTILMEEPAVDVLHRFLKMPAVATELEEE